MEKRVNLTEEQRKTSNRNRDAMRRKLGIVGTGLVLHHIDPELRYNDIERYIEWREEDLTIMTLSEHSALHMALLKNDPYYSAYMSQQTKGKEPWNKGKHYKQRTTNRKPVSDETRKQISERMKGRKFSEETKAKLSASLKGRVGSATGKHWFNNGITETYAFDCPDGFTKGRLDRKMKRYAELTQNESVRIAG